MNKLGAFAAFNLALAVGLGALGAHFLKEQLSPALLASFETGVRYHLFHALALLALSFGSTFRNLNRPMNLMVIGMLLFSVSIYVLSTRSLFLDDTAAAWLGPVTPLGGLMLIISWLWIGVSLLKKDQAS